MVRGSPNQKNDSAKSRRKCPGSLSHHPKSNNLLKTFVKSESSNSNAQSSILEYLSIKKNDEKASENLALVAANSDSYQEPENIFLENNNCTSLQESVERLENHHVTEKNFTSDDEINKTEPRVPCSPTTPSTAFSKLKFDNSPKKHSKVKRCLNVLKTNNQTLNVAKVLQVSRNSGNSQTKLPEFFPVRRSVRKTEKTVLEERRKTLVEAILSNKEDGLEVRMFEGKGRGIVSTRKFHKGEFVVEYAGELISMEEAQKREASYSQNENIGCYMYYFKHRNQQHCIDATEDTGRFGRLLNHSRYGNLSTKTVEIKGVPHLILVAKEDIESGCELTYDYGDRSKHSLQYHPWLAH